MSDGKSAMTEEAAALPATPEDVAILYSWANLPGAKYRDFSASRREYRAQQRARLAEEQQQVELEAARALEDAARKELEDAHRSLQVAQQAEAEVVANAESKANAEEQFRQAQANVDREQAEVQRRQQSAETLRLRAQSARTEMMEARKRAEEQAARYAEFDAQYRSQMDGRVEESPPGQLDDPYYYTGQVDPAYFAPTPGVRTSQASRASTERKTYVLPVHPGSDEFDAGTLQSYRANTTFAPSPAQDYRSFSPMRDLPPLRDSLPSRDVIGRREDRASLASEEQVHVSADDVESVHGWAAADDDYYSDGARERFRKISDRFQGYGTAEHDLHIRPQPRFVQNHDGIPSAEVHAPSDAWESKGERTERRHRRSSAADNRARTVRQPRHDESVPIRVMELTSQADSFVPPAWLAYNEDQALEAQDNLPQVPQPVFAPVEFGPPARAVRSSPFHAQSYSTLIASASSFSGQSTSSSSELRKDTTMPADQAFVAQAGILPAPDTLQQSRERVASRWFALQGLMEQQADVEKNHLRPASIAASVVTLLSLSGGVGKTSMAATLGRALSSLGEKVMMADTNAHGLLPYYFGARDLRPGAVRTFNPPAGSTDASVLMVHYEQDRMVSDEDVQNGLLKDLAERATTVQRIIVDLASGGFWLARRLATTKPYFLVPVAPDMNSILTTQSIESIFGEIRDAENQPVRPYYVLNQFDSALPLHLDVREALRKALGDRLLPVTISRAPAVSEALAEGMTVIDYAPGSPIVDDYMRLANWIRGLAAPGIADVRGSRWREQ